MRTFGLFLLVCGLGLAGYGVFMYFQSTKTVRGTERELSAARSAWEGAKGTTGEEAARGVLEGLQLRVLGENEAAAGANVVSKWWMAGGGLVVFCGFVAMLLGRPKRRRTKATRFWA